MKCHYCGEEVAENQSYCMCCGTRQEPQPLPEPEEPAVPEIQPVQIGAVVPEKPETAEVQECRPAKREPVRTAVKYQPRLKLPTGRGLGKMFFLGILTLGIYPTVIWSRIVTELNIAASRYDGERTMPYFGMLMLAPITLGIYPLVWIHRFCRRIGEELARRGIGYKFGPSAFWLWGVLGSLILVGPFVFTYKLMKSMNKINADFNIHS